MLGEGHRRGVEASRRSAHYREIDSIVGEIANHRIAVLDGQPHRERGPALSKGREQSRDEILRGGRRNHIQHAGARPVQPLQGLVGLA